MNLILYYSRKGENYVNGRIENLAKGNTEICAEYLQQIVGGDLFEIETIKPYSTAYAACTKQAQDEIRFQARPALKHMLHDISKYDNIFICGPCWWGTYPMPMFTQLDALDFTGKNIYPLMTHEGSGLGHCQKDLKTACPGAILKAGLAIHGADAAKSKLAIEHWVQKNMD